LLDVGCNSIRNTVVGTELSLMATRPIEEEAICFLIGIFKNLNAEEEWGKSK
jgi:hypothetical protein